MAIKGSLAKFSIHALAIHYTVQLVHCVMRVLAPFQGGSFLRTGICQAMKISFPCSICYTNTRLVTKLTFPSQIGLYFAGWNLNHVPGTKWVILVGYSNLVLDRGKLALESEVGPHRNLGY